MDTVDSHVATVELRKYSSGWRQLCAPKWKTVVDCHVEDVEDVVRDLPRPQHPTLYDSAREAHDTQAHDWAILFPVANPTAPLAPH